MRESVANIDNDKYLNDSINSFNNTMAQIDSSIVKNGWDITIQNKLDDAIIKLISLCKVLDSTLTKNNSRKESKFLVDLFRQKTFKWFMQSYCIKRSFLKPQGYAGDYDVIDRIYQNVPFGKGMEFALDKYFLDNKGSQAMRSRKKLIVTKISSLIKAKMEAQGRQVSLIDLGCGPGRDILEILSNTGPFGISMLDQDLSALEYSRNILNSYEDHIKYTRINLLRVIVGGKHIAKQFGTHDIATCIGLYDYLDEETSIRLTRSSHNLLKENGILIISNWDISNPSKTEMEWVCDWHVHHRTKRDMVKIIEGSGIPKEKYELINDESGHFHIAFIKK
jgi:extracellular factor (EF) 3-hydroxypalmitic acid methyl ester biosynthesis protein